MYELVLVVTIYQRRAWHNGLMDDHRPTAEQSFHQPLPDRPSKEHISQAMERCSLAARGWIEHVKPSLWGYVVVTVYAIEEVSDVS